MREYQHICALDYSITHSCSIAKSRAAAGRNRYTNVLPFDYNRCVCVCVWEGGGRRGQLQVWGTGKEQEMRRNGLEPCLSLRFGLV